MDVITPLEVAELPVLLARHGIYAPNGEIYAYELLYRNNSLHSNIDNSDDSAGTKATSSVIAQIFSNLDMDAIVHNKSIFINFTRTDIILNVPRLLPKERVVIQVLETQNFNSLLKTPCY